MGPKVITVAQNLKKKKTFKRVEKDNRKAFLKIFLSPPQSISSLNLY
jgi:hypothetical protein